MCHCTPNKRTPWCENCRPKYKDEGGQWERPPEVTAPELQGRKDLEDYKPKVMRPGTELVAYSPEPVVGLLEFQGSIYCATSGGVWRMVKGEDGKDVFERILFAL